MNVLLYAEVEIICALFMLVIFTSTGHRVGRQHSMVAFRSLVLSVIAMLLLDIVWMLLQGDPTPERITVNTWFNVLYMTMCGVNNYLWLYYLETYLGVGGREERHFRYAWAAPAVILAAMFVSVWTGWMFSVDSGNIYRHGPYYAVVLIALYLDPLVGAFKLMYSMRSEEDGSVRSEKRTLLAVTVLTLFSAVFGILFNDLPCTFPCVSLGVFLMYNNLQEHSISTDSLTGINNRLCFDRWLGKLAKEKDARFFLFLIDIDDFKRINDSCGHYEGDRAIQKTAELLNASVRNTGCFLARYGGDEFAIIGRFGGRVDAITKKREIERAFENYDWVRHGKYSISVSIGIGEFGPGAELTAKDLIAAADGDMYREKNEKNVLSVSNF
mgnify:CR=1 FL=1